MAAPANLPQRVAPAVPSQKRSITRAIQDVPPALSFAFFCLIGVVTMMASFVANTNSVVDTRTGKLFGYLYEINWGPNYIFVIPIAMYFCTAAVGGISQVISQLGQSKMIVCEDGAAATVDEINLSWERYARRAILISEILSFIAVAASLLEWWIDCVRPASYGSIAAVPSTLVTAPGWNLAYLLSGGTVPKLGVAFFGVLAFVGQALVASAFLLFVSLVLAFATWIFQFTTENSPWELFPTLISPDRRRGFEHFEVFIENLLFAALALFCVFFMTRLQYVYNDSTARSIMNFISNDIAVGFFQGMKVLFTEGKTDLFAAGRQITYSTAMVGAAAGVTVILAFLVPATVVRQSAIRSGTRLLDWIGEHGNLVLSVFGVTPEAARNAVNSMDFWPMRYPRPVQLLVFVTVAAVCFVFYKFALILVGALLFKALRELTKILKLSKN